ncbi:MAG TPA: Gfo/Idh/MocA family oxidoreductase [Bacteroidales bacterium]|nr:Gfo/Idh/MocA family oxidoreductase [Bacteroidales bacterium]HNR42451.1 Gfo/Idh/MocA family oxidoreductase [Bacteroidales bacterium]HPV15910.1 Gfo/Idh/MocA family oxidoreductase [Bacteroidales bacterium]HQG78125.1 Gfo/Idh/MocA family oxidoreductase [Bacteroidales bacterium]
MASANDKVILALIGAGGRGTQVILSMQKCLPGVEVKYVCDVDQERGGRAIDELEKQQKVRPERINDMRFSFDDKDVDAVVICTPEHWHALATVRACQAGKDVYVEKNISLTIPEGRKMIEAAKRYGRIIQCGFQNRSAPYNFSARDYILSGKLGKIALIKAYCMLPGNKPWLYKEDSPVPEGLDWDQWLGPAPLVPYNVSRHKGYNEFWAYSCGLPLADCCHVIDLARMVIGDPGHPASVYCAGGRVLYDDNREIPDNQTITYDFGGIPVTVEASIYGEYLSKASPEIRFGNLFPNWPFNSDRMEIYGTEGMMYLGRHGAGWQVLGKNSEIIAQEYGYFPDEVHQQDFINCIRTRKVPNSNIEQGHLSATLVHLANISYRLGKKQLFFDSVNEKVMNEEEANIISEGHYRPKYEIPEIV